MTGNVKTGVALVGGYLLGRTKKAKMAIGLGMFLAGKKLNFDPAQLGKLVANSNVLGGLNDQVRRELVDATKSAATSALTKRATGLADSLHERTQRLDGTDEDGTGEEAAEDGAARDDEQGEQQDKGAQEKKPTPRRKATGPAAKSSKAKASPSSSAKGKASSGARRTASGGAGKTASSARKTASGARKTASRSRTTKTGGGRDE